MMIEGQIQTIKDFRRGMTAFLATAWGPKSIRYVTAGGDVVTGQDEWWSQRTFVVGLDTPIYPTAEAAAAAHHDEQQRIARANERLGIR